MIGNSSDATNFPHKLLLTDTQVSKISEAFENGSSANRNFSKAQFSEMIQSRGFLADISVITAFIDPHKILIKGANKPEDLSKKVTLTDIIKIIDTSKNFIKDFKFFFATGINLTNNEIKDIRKVVKCLESRETLLKETTTKITSQEGEFLNFFKPFIKNILTPLTKSVLMSLGLSAGCQQQMQLFKKKSIDQDKSINNFK